MVFALSENLFIEIIAMAQSDHPSGMFVVCLNMIIELALGIKSMPIIHNDKMHKSLLKVNQLILSHIKENIIEINDPDQKDQKIRTILDFLKMLTDLSLDTNSDISKFFINEAS